MLVKLTERSSIRHSPKFLVFVSAEVENQIWLSRV
jgi:hypothetical protein